LKKVWKSRVFTQALHDEALKFMIIPQTDHLPLLRERMVRRRLSNRVSRISGPREIIYIFGERRECCWFQYKTGGFFKKLFFYCLLYFEYDISGQNLHFMGSFGMVDKFSHKFMIGGSLRFKRTIHSDIFAGN